MPGTLEYQFEIDIFKREKITLKTEKMPYKSAIYLADKLGRKGIHYRINEIDSRFDNYLQITSRMLRMPKRRTT
jgi:two-component sensor histidine kinase